MHKSHFYTLDAEWPKLVNDLNTRCEKIRIPFIPYDLPEDFVRRPKEFFASAALFACTFCPDSVHIVAGGSLGIYSFRLLL